MSLTVNKGYSVQAASSNPGTWGAGASTALNEGVIQVIDANMAGLLTESLSSLNVTLSASDTQNCMIRCTGSLLSNIVISPGGGVLMYGFYCFENVTTGNFTVTLTTGAGSVVLPQNRTGVLFIDSTNGPRIVSIAGVTNADPIPTGTVMVFYQNAAPSGWTISSSLNDYGLRIVSSGGGTTLNPSGSSYSTVFGQTATGSHVLTLNEIPAHTHNTAGADSVPAGSANAKQILNPGIAGVTGSAGAGAGHTHTISLQLQTANVILATKN